jgi:hypothetical protein
MPDLTARQYDTHYRKLGLPSGASLSEIDKEYKFLALMMHPDRLTPGPLQERALARLKEINNARDALVDYWKKNGKAPPSVQKRTTNETPPPDLTPRPASQPCNQPEPESQYHSPPPPAPSPGPEKGPPSNSDAFYAEPDYDQKIGPQQISTNPLYAIFKIIDKRNDAESEIITFGAILGLIAVSAVLVWIPVLLISLVLGVAPHVVSNALGGIIVLLLCTLMCVIPLWIRSEFAFFKQLQAPFIGALRLPLAASKAEISSAISKLSDDQLLGWKIVSQEFPNQDRGGLITARKTFESTSPVQSYAALVKIRIDPLSHESSCMAYWFETEKAPLYKGRLLSSIRQTKFELERLIKDN